jgi:hypothetical protein
MAVGSACTSTFFEACSAFTRVAACTLALSPIRDTLIEGFSHFVTSVTAPIASGWSDCRVGLAPTGKRRLCTAHARSSHSKSLHAYWMIVTRTRAFGIIVILAQSEFNLVGSPLYDVALKRHTLSEPQRLADRPR